ncbi:MAG: hypothetical protein A3F13_03495 [Gammaproteobacteria bacterium RIFCSPHIGHO2_12_FULL_40_19]|nr:MAG: hypothetical protein A3F13_03495 [Gammaproteobacteria bacterium RIFCSPHIGHO2_12_FULL_40_19]
MKIQELIGQRLSQSRKKRGLTLKALSQLSDDVLKPTCIANWEGGSRMPGPKEALLLGKLLDVAPSYLLGLSDDENGNIVLHEPEFKSVPLLTLEQAMDPINVITKLRVENPKDIQYAPLGIPLQNKEHAFYFGFEISDDGMAPQLMQGDVVIIDPRQKPKPGNLVAAIVGTQGLIVRQYKQRGFIQSFESFELVALNANWASIVVDSPDIADIVGTVCQVTHVYS